MGVIGHGGTRQAATARKTLAGPAVVRIPAIEGLRAWLAWAVVFYHLFITTNIDAHYDIVAKAEMIGSGAVTIFMMLSGFVITGLLLTRKEAWLPFITRRAFRLFPAYWIALAVGAIAMLIRPYVFADVSWASDPAFISDMAYHARNTEAVLAAPFEQTLFHVLLLQGLPPPAYMAHSATTILGPAWSLTVEWQFYLAAPFLIWMARNQTRAVILVIVAAILVFGMQRGWASDLLTTASLPNFLYVFVIGIFCRLALPHIPQHGGFGWAAAAAIVAIGVQTGLAPAIAVWLAFVVLIACRPETATGRTRPGLMDRVFAAALESPLATYLGDRSYSVYILHSPIIVLVGYVLLPMYDFSRQEALIAMTLVLVPTILIASELMYRFVERPMIRLGARVADRIAIATANPAILRKPIAPAV